MKRLVKLGLLVLFGAFMASCINNRRIVYVQDHTKKKSHDYLADTVFINPPDDYRLVTGDIIHVKSDHAILSQSFQQLDNTYLQETRTLQLIPALAGFVVDTTGRVTLPIIGKVRVRGLTIFEAMKTIEARAATVFEEPAIRVFMLNYYITVLGEVQRPGRYQVLNHRINIFEAMGICNDATDFASREDVKVIRSRDGVTHLYHVDLTDQNILASPFFYLHPNDVLLVRPQKRKKFATRDVQNIFQGIGAAVAIATLVLLINNTTRR